MIGGGILVTLVLAASGPVPGTKDYGIILKKNLFAPLPPPPTTTATPQKPTLTITKPPPLDDVIAVRGILYFGEDRRENRVVIEDLKSKALDTYAAGSTIQGARILEIRANGAVCEYAGEEFLLSEKGATRYIPTQSVEIINVKPAAVLTEIEQDPGRYASLRATPVTEGNAQIGYRIEGIPPGTALSKLGIQDGDVITKVNSTSLDRPDRPLIAWENILKYGMERALVRILRNGTPRFILYQLSYD